MKEDELVTELTLEELKEAFRWETHMQISTLLVNFDQNFYRLFDDVGEGFITVLRFKAILKEIDEDFTDDEIEGIIIDVSLNHIIFCFILILFSFSDRLR